MTTRCSFCWESARVESRRFRTNTGVMSDKRPSKRCRESFGHTPLSVEEDIPWNCGQLVIGTGMGALPVMNEVRQEARRRGVKLVIRPIGKAIQILNEQPKDTNAILHLTC